MCMVKKHAPLDRPPRIPFNRVEPKPLSWPSINGPPCRRLSTFVSAITCSVLLLNTVVLARLLVRLTAGGGLGAKVTSQRLAVIVPTHGGDLGRALLSLSQWPTECSPTTLKHVELLLYYAGAANDTGWIDNAIPELEKTGGRCFSRTNVIFGNLTAEENVYPKGSSVQFYKLFLDKDLRAQLSSFAAFAIIEWDVLVVCEKSFEALYNAAFEATDDFWVKGSTLAGTNFHTTATIIDYWEVLGHLNGNAIYSNSDPAFVEFVNYTLTRWGHHYSYDVALWTTIADFPYSWPLWQRFSHKFVATTLIANVGFLDADPQVVVKALASQTMFIHGSTSGGGGTQFGMNVSRTTAAAAVPRHLDSHLPVVDCRPECAGPVVHDDNGGGVLSAICDYTDCSSPEESGMVGEDKRFTCGAGDEERFGRHCRLCYTDVHEAIEAERALTMPGLRASPGNQHVIMCDTLRPPQSTNCNPKCSTKLDTICDHRCGSGIFGDHNCNWRDRGAHCRHCFHDLNAAISADKAAKRTGGRVIMCNTHEPPVARSGATLKMFEQEHLKQLALAAEGAAIDAKKEDRGGFRDQGGDDDGDDDGGDDDEAYEAPPSASLLPYTKGIVRGQICVYTTGYFLFLAETEASVQSFQHFMPGVRVRVAVDPVYFSVFNRTIGAYHGVAVVNATSVGGHAALLADVHCGEGTKLIYYIAPGEIILRTFTAKDTHSTAGDLLVPFIELERVDAIHLKRAQATTSLLGFHAPSFSYGTDIILPAWVNRQLRHVLVAGKRPSLVMATASEASMSGGGATEEEEQEQEKQRELALSFILDTKDAYVPEVLAALAYSRNPPGIWFHNPQQWVTHHMFQPVSIWDIPLIKPRIGCLASLALVASGYDVARELNRFVRSNCRSCETGYMHLDRSQLHKKASVEFGAPATNNLPMPDIADLRVSVVYSTADVDDTWLLNTTLPTVLENFADALEIVVVVGDEPAAVAYRQVLDHHQSSVALDLSVVVDPDMAAGGFRDGNLGGGADEGWEGTKRLFPLLWADKHCSGDFVLHLDTDSVLLRRVTYDDIFHFRKPVIPFTRFNGEDPDMWQHHPGTFCWRSKGSQALGLSEDELLVHDFSAYDTHVYPIALYPNLRAHLRVTRCWEDSVKDVLKAGACEGAAAVSAQGDEQEIAGRRRQFRREMHFNLMATFMWYHMPRIVHWRAIDPLDLQPDEWLTDPHKYRTWSCNLRIVPTAPTEPPRVVAAAVALLRRGVAGLNSVEACHVLGARVNAERLQAAAGASVAVGISDSWSQVGDEGKNTPFLGLGG